VKAIEYWLARLVLATLSATPLSSATRLARLYVRVLDVALPRLRRTALKNLEMAGFAGRERITTGVFDSVARLVVAFARFPQITSALRGAFCAR
jgi:lauroyl/myristoyl acyltransferase